MFVRLPGYAGVSIVEAKIIRSQTKGTNFFRPPEGRNPRLYPWYKGIDRGNIHDFVMSTLLQYATEVLGGQRPWALAMSVLFVSVRSLAWCSTDILLPILAIRLDCNSNLYQ